uniref:SPFH domain-containing protein n=1 Tax=Tessaracoccus sp. TaxID=1971211 RepID=UPI0026267FD6|nr:SPFH domain-containing protein [Tessaracoccus sp.]
MPDVSIFIMIGVAVLVIATLAATLKIIRQQQVALVERLGKFRKALKPGPHLVVPFIDQIRYTLDMREQVVPFPPQGVITEDNLMVSIDSVIYFQIVDPARAAYEAQNYRAAIEQLTMTTLRNIIGGMDLEAALTSREEINQRLRTVLDEATGKWGIKVNRVELRAIEPPPTIRDAMEKGARAERDKRAAILLAEGQRQSQILAAGGDREAAILRAQGDREAQVLRAQAERQAQMLRAEGEAQAISTVFGAIHAGQPDQALLAYQYMQMLPKLAQGDANKVWIVPSELNDALKGLGQVADAEGVRDYVSRAVGDVVAPPKIDVHAEIEEHAREERERSNKTVERAIADARALDAPAPGRVRGPMPAISPTTAAELGLPVEEPGGQDAPDGVGDGDPVRGPQFVDGQNPLDERPAPQRAGIEEQGGPLDAGKDS